MSAHAYAPRDVLALNANLRPSDESLFARARRCDEAALEQLYSRYARTLRRIAERVLGDRDAADEVVSEVFERVALANDRTARGDVGRWLASAARVLAVEWRER